MQSLTQTEGTTLNSRSIEGEMLPNKNFKIFKQAWLWKLWHFQAIVDNFLLV